MDPRHPPNTLVATAHQRSVSIGPPGPAMPSHHPGVGCPVPVVVGGITSDRLYPLRLQEELAELLPGCSKLQIVDSIYGHDGFLVESEAVGELVRQTLDLACPR